MHECPACHHICRCDGKAEWVDDVPSWECLHCDDDDDDDIIAEDDE